ncbi:MAG: right-handed parallel beta-helix repeat-containing protein [Candidatus Bathyarchaeota archaeon]|nr:right-handed parallel beta-helix repeat-containing protein [Candidatus Bathyarchaeota archaeon]MDH5595177.1 right-handed parallel beta-helix repeat-containing protein [Candidatus Bathyarchaeota archaeon]
MNKTLLTSLTVFFLIASTLLVTTKTATAQPDVIYVPTDYPTIQEAINAASEGDTILIRNGTYFENIIVNKTVAIVGENRDATILDGLQRRDVILMTSDDVSISDLTVQNGKYCGVEVLSSVNCTLTNIVARNNEFGIDLFESRNCVLIGNTATNNELGLSLGHSGGNYLRDNSLYGNAENFNCYLPGTPQNIEDYLNDADTSNTVDGNPVYYWINQNDEEVPSDAGAVIVVNSTNINAASLTLTHNKHGILFFATSNSVIRETSIGDNSFGILLIYSHSCTITDNHLAENRMIGVHLTSSNDCHTTNNVLSNSQSTDTATAFVIEGSQDFEIAENLISNNSRGISLKESSGAIYHNSLVNNTQQVVLSQPGNNIVWHSGYPSGGNHWSDYAGLDDHHGPDQDVPGIDGIGDSPHALDANNSDTYPLMGPYTDFDVPWGEEIHHFTTICNSAITNFQWNYEAREISFALTGAGGAIGFCRITIPIRLIEGPYTVLINNDAISSGELPISNGTHTFLYFTYVHGNYEVAIVPKMLHLESAYQELVKQYDLLLGNYSALNTMYQQLLVEYFALQENSSSLQNKYNNLSSDFNSRYNNLLSDLDHLQSSYDQLNSLYNSLQEFYNTLQESTSELQASHNQLEATISEIITIRDLTVILTAAAIVLVATTLALMITTIYYAKRKPRAKNVNTQA